MSQQVEGPRKTFTAGEALPAHRRVLIFAATGAYGPTVKLADATEPCMGVTEDYAASGDPVTIYLANAQGTRKMMATAAAITANNSIYAANDGYVAAAGTVVEGKALETTAGVAGDILEVLPINSADLVAAAGITLPTVTFNGATTVNKITLPTNLADALSILDSAADILVIATTTGSPTVTITPATTITGALTLSASLAVGTTLAVTGRAAFTGNVANTAGVGITGTADSYVTSVEKIGSIIKTTLLVEIDGLNSGGTAADIIGADGAGVAHLGQITAAVNGTIFAGKITCLETPTGGDPDVDLYSATEATGVEDVGIGTLTATQLINHGDWAGGEQGNLTALPAANKYLYLVAGDATDATYTAGIFLIELYGKA